MTLIGRLYNIRIDVCSGYFNSVSGSYDGSWKPYVPQPDKVYFHKLDSVAEATFFNPQSYKKTEIIYIKALHL